jgi:hypothetical protein
MSDTPDSGWQRYLWWLRSRKVQVGLVGIASSIASTYGLHLNADVAYTILAIAVAIIFGISHEDAGTKIGTALAQLLSNGNGNNDPEQ